MKAPVGFAREIAKAKNLEKSLSGKLLNKRFRDIVTAEDHYKIKHRDNGKDYLKAVSKIVNHKNTLWKLKEADALVTKMEGNPTVFPTLAITSLLDKIFVEDRGYKFADHYNNFLRRKGLETAYFQIYRFIILDEYEQAIELFWNRYSHYMNGQPWVNVFKMMKSLRVYPLLQAASTRNDTQQILKLIEVLEENRLITPNNYASCFNMAICNNNYEVIKYLYHKLSQIELTQSCIELIMQIAITHEDLELTLNILPNIENPLLNLSFIMKICSHLSPASCWEIMEKITGDIEWETIEKVELPPELQGLPDLDDFTNLDTYMKILSKLEKKITKKLLIRSLLSSINNGKGHFGSASYILNYLNRKNMMSLIDKKDIDILSKLASYYGSKVATVLMVDLLTKHKLTISPQNYYYFMRAECYGTEHEGLYLFAVRCLRDHGKLSRRSINLIENIAKITCDAKATRFIEECNDVSKASMIIDYTYLTKHFESIDERTKVKHDILNGFGKYDEDRDFTNMRLLISSEKWVNIMMK